MKVSKDKLIVLLFFVIAFAVGFAIGEIVGFSIALTKIAKIASNYINVDAERLEQLISMYFGGT